MSDAANRLAELLALENAALAALDLPRAGSLLGAKQQALAALAAAQPPPRLEALLQENRRLLEQAIAVQGQVIGLVAAALQQASRQPRYAASGAPARTSQPVAFTLSSRA